MKIEELIKNTKEGAAKPRRHPKYEEDKLQIQCRYWWDTVFVYEIKDTFGINAVDFKERLRMLLHHSPNEAKLLGHDRDGAKRKAMGVRAGFPDFILLIPNKDYAFFAIELKSAKGRQSDKQKAYEAAVNMAGGKYQIVRSRDEFEENVRQYMASVRLHQITG